MRAGGSGDVRSPAAQGSVRRRRRSQARPRQGSCTDHRADTVADAPGADRQPRERPAARGRGRALRRRWRSVPADQTVTGVGRDPPGLAAGSRVRGVPSVAACAIAAILSRRSLLRGRPLRFGTGMTGTCGARSRSLRSIAWRGLSRRYARRACGRPPAGRPSAGNRSVMGCRSRGGAPLARRSRPSRAPIPIIMLARVFVRVFNPRIARRHGRSGRFTAQIARGDTGRRTRRDAGASCVLRGGGDERPCLSHPGKPAGGGKGTVTAATCRWSTQPVFGALRTGWPAFRTVRRALLLKVDRLQPGPGSSVSLPRRRGHVAGAAEPA